MKLLRNKLDLRCNEITCDLGLYGAISCMFMAAEILVSSNLSLNCVILIIGIEAQVTVIIP